MNRYRGEWLFDYEQFLFHAREHMKREAYNTLCDENASFDDKVAAAEEVIKSHYMRSVQAFINNYGKKRTHPSFEEYAAMMLNQDTYFENLDKDIRYELIDTYGKRKGIEEGTYYGLPK